jgi:hypothetical protein
MIQLEFEIFKSADLPDVPHKEMHLFWENKLGGNIHHLACFACDLLAMPIGSSEVERSFSEQRRTDTKQSTRASALLAELKAMLYQNRALERCRELAPLRSTIFETWFQSAHAAHCVGSSTSPVLERGLMVFSTEDEAALAVALAETQQQDAFMATNPQLDDPEEEGPLVVISAAAESEQAST